LSRSKFIKTGYHLRNISGKIVIKSAYLINIDRPGAVIDIFESGEQAMTSPVVFEQLLESCISLSDKEIRGDELF
jgi:hypothetical protein